MRRLLSRLGAVGLAVVLTLLVGGGLGGAAYAHGDLEGGSPGPGDNVATGTDVVSLRFSEINADAPVLVALLDSEGEPLPVGEAVAEEREGEAVVCARLEPLSAGVHTVEYSINSADGDLVRGKYTFEASATGTAVPPDDCAGLDLPAPGEAQTLDEMGTGSFPLWIIAVLVVALLAALALVVRRVRTERHHDAG